MAKHDIHGRKLFIQLISHPDQSDTENKIISDRIISYDDEKTLTDFDLVYRKWIVDYLDSISSGFQVISAGGVLPSDPGVGDVHILDDGSIMQWDGSDWNNNGSIPTGGGGPSYTSDPSLPSGGGFLAYLRSNYTSANPGDVVYREGTTQLIKCTCYYVDANPALNKWSKIIETIE